jgi:hypothetical protein
MASPIALVDLIWTGHHPSYFKLFARALLELGHQVVAVCPAPDEIREWARTLHPALAKRISAIGIDPQTRPPASIPFAAFTRVAGHWKLVRAALASHAGPAPGLVLFTWIDTLLHPFLAPWLMDRLFPSDWTGLYFHPRHLRLAPASAFGRLAAKWQTAALRARRCRGVFVLDEEIGAALSASIAGKRVYGLPDIADTSAPDSGYELARTVRARAAGRIAVSLVGGLAQRKGFMTLVRAAQMLPPSRFFFLFAGPLIEASFPAEEYEALRQFVAGNPENCLFHFQRIPEEGQFNAVLDATDIVFAAYLDFPHSSNLIPKAAFLHKLVIVSRGHLMAQQVARYRLGLEIDEGDALQCAAAIQALAEPAGRATPDYDAYLRDHSPARFVAVLERALLDMG